MGLIKTIRDYFGRPIPAQPDPAKLATRTVVHSIRDRADVGSILSDVTPASIRSIFSDADNGYPARQIELAQTIRERDEHVGSVDQTRRLAVMEMKFLIEPGDESNQAKLAAEAFQAEWEALETRDVIGRMMDAVLEQWHVERVMWETDGVLHGRKHWRIAGIEDEDARRLVWPQTSTERPGDLTSIIPAISMDWSYTNTEPLTAGQYLVHAYRAVRGRPGKGALVRSLAVLWMFKKFSLDDLAELLEKWGRPWPVLTYDPKATPEQIREWLSNLADSMADRVIAVPQGASVQVVDAKASGADTPHINLHRLCNEGISKLLVGSTTIADAAAHNDSVSSPTHAGVREDIRNADAFAVASSIRRSLIVPWTFWNFGPSVAAPKYGPITETSPDPESRGRVFVQARDLSLTVKSEQVYSDLGLEKPKSVPDELKLTPVGGGLFPSLPGPAVAGVPAIPGTEPKPAAPTTEPVPAGGQEAEVLPELVLNGAQIQAAVQIVKSVAAGEMPRDAGIGQLIVLFNLKPEQAESIMGSAGTSTPTTPNPRPGVEPAPAV